MATADPPEFLLSTRKGEPMRAAPLGPYRRDWWLDTALAPALCGGDAGGDAAWLPRAVVGVVAAYLTLRAPAWHSYVRHARVRTSAHAAPLPSAAGAAAAAPAAVSDAAGIWAAAQRATAIGTAAGASVSHGGRYVAALATATAFTADAKSAAASAASAVPEWVQVVGDRPVREWYADMRECSAVTGARHDCPTFRGGYGWLYTGTGVSVMCLVPEQPNAPAGSSGGSSTAELSADEYWRTRPDWAVGLVFDPLPVPACAPPPPTRKPPPPPDTLDAEKDPHHDDDEQPVTADTYTPAADGDPHAANAVLLQARTGECLGMTSSWARRSYGRGSRLTLYAAAAAGDEPVQNRYTSPAEAVRDLVPTGEGTHGQRHLLRLEHSTDCVDEHSRSGFIYRPFEVPGPDVPDDGDAATAARWGDAHLYVALRADTGASVALLYPPLFDAAALAVRQFPI